MSLLTIKHVEKDGHESIQQAHSVSFYPARETEGGKPNDEAHLEVFGCTEIGGAVDEHGHCRYGSGVVYVMNDAGSTVGKYELN